VFIGQAERLVPDKNWSDIRSIIADVMENGAEQPYKKVRSKEKFVNGELVQVVYHILPAGSYRISNAWVK
jgi:hypothetical protein